MCCEYGIDNKILFLHNEILSLYNVYRDVL